MNSISNLFLKPFSTYSIEEKIKLKELGRSLPDVDIQKTQNVSSSLNVKSRVRKFNRNMYNKNNWIRVCDKKNAFLCFPGVLFGSGPTWTKNGVTDLVHIYGKIKTHENSKVHVNNTFSFSLLGKSNVLSQLNLAYRESKIKQNEQVDKNRYILNIIISCIRFCGALELALRGHNETEESPNKGVFRELINFSSQLDRDLKDHFSKATVFKGTSKTIQNELLECMLKVYHEEVTRELNKANFVAIIADGTRNNGCF